MAWSVPQFSRGEIDRAGRAFIDPNCSQADRLGARTVINNWRSSHGFPLNTLQVSMRDKARSIDSDALIAQRIKRLPSIGSKLIRFPEMKLSRMQDLGGSRAVMADISDVNAVENAFRNSRHKHSLRRYDDYIVNPKPSGYRGVHIVYRYQSDRSATYNGLHIELQIRSKLQHAWATAVETVGTFTRQALKSSLGEQEWLRFFALMSSEFARDEGTAIVPGTPDSITEHQEQLARLVEQLSVIERLSAYGSALSQNSISPNRGKYFLLQLDIPGKNLTITAFRDTISANEAFDAAESASGADLDASTTQDAVLVSVDSITGLRNAYPNYFLDTTEFIERVRIATN